MTLPTCKIHDKPMVDNWWCMHCVDSQTDQLTRQSKAIHILTSTLEDVLYNDIGDIETRVSDGLSQARGVLDV